MNTARFLKYVWPFYNIMHERFKNRLNETRSATNSSKYKKQSNFRVSLLRKTKREYSSNLNVKYVSNKKTFWVTVKAFFSGKGLNSNFIIFTEKRKIITNDREISNIMNNYFTEIASHLKSHSHPPKKICFICFNESPLKMMKNALYFILKALSVLKIFKFLS